MQLARLMLAFALASALAGCAAMGKDCGPHCLRQTVLVRPDKRHREPRLRVPLPDVPRLDRREIQNSRW